MNLTFDTAPSGLTIFLDGIAHQAPFVYDTLVGFDRTIEARDQTVGADAVQLTSSDQQAMPQRRTLFVGARVSARSCYMTTFSVAADTTPPSPPSSPAASTVTATTGCPSLGPQVQTM